MAFSSLKLNASTPSLPRVGIRNHSLLRTKASLQFEKSTPKITLNGGSASGISRRDAFSCVTSTLLLTSLIQIEPANARIASPDIRRKIMERLEQLREKAGLKKKENTAPKDEKKLPKVESKDGDKLPKEEKMLPKIENKDGGKLPKEEKTLPKLENKHGNNVHKEEKALPKSENKDGDKLPKEQPNLVGASS